MGLTRFLRFLRGHKGTRPANPTSPVGANPNSLSRRTRTRNYPSDQHPLGSRAPDHTTAILDCTAELPRIPSWTSSEYDAVFTPLTTKADPALVPQSTITQDPEINWGNEPASSLELQLEQLRRQRDDIVGPPLDIDRVEYSAVSDLYPSSPSELPFTGQHEEGSSGFATFDGVHADAGSVSGIYDRNSSGKLSLNPFRTRTHPTRVRVSTPGSDIRAQRLRSDELASEIERFFEETSSAGRSNSLASVASTAYLPRQRHQAQGPFESTTGTVNERSQRPTSPAPSADPAYPERPAAPSPRRWNLLDETDVNLSSWLSAAKPEPAQEASSPVVEHRANERRRRPRHVKFARTTVAVEAEGHVPKLRGDRLRIQYGGPLTDRDMVNVGQLRHELWQQNIDRRINKSELADILRMGEHEALLENAPCWRPSARDEQGVRSRRDGESWESLDSDSFRMDDDLDIDVSSPRRRGPWPPTPPRRGPVLAPFSSRLFRDNRHGTKLRRSRGFDNLRSASRSSGLSALSESSLPSVDVRTRALYRIVGLSDGEQWLWRVVDDEGDVLAEFGDIDLVLVPSRPRHPPAAFRNPYREPTLWLSLRRTTQPSL